MHALPRNVSLMTTKQSADFEPRVFVDTDFLDAANERIDDARYVVGLLEELRTRLSRADLAPEDEQDIGFELAEAANRIAALGVLVTMRAAA